MRELYRHRVIMKYLDWNDAIAGCIFSLDNEFRPVLFSVTHELIEELGDFNDYLSACAEGPPWFTDSQGGRSLYFRIYNAYENWRNRQPRNRKFPPYLGYLGLLVIAESRKEKGQTFEESLDRLIQPVGISSVGGHRYQQMVTDKVWPDLQAWSGEDMNGQLGLFELFRVQDYRHAGIVRVQNILSPKELKKLPSVFYDSDLDPAISPSANELIETGSKLSSAQAFLKSRDETKQELLEAILRSHFDKWDGRPSDDYEGGDRSRGSLILSARTTSDRLILELRAKTIEEYPSGGFRLVKDGIAFTAMPFKQHLSQTVVGADQQPYQVSEIELSEDSRFDSSRSDGLTVPFTLRSSTIRVLVPGEREGVPGCFFESRQLPESGKGLLLVAESKIPTLVDREEDFDELLQLHLAGIPRGWALFGFKQVLTCEKLKNIHPCLNVTQREVARWVGGIPYGYGGRRYMCFSPPELHIPVQDDLESLSVIASWPEGNMSLGPPDELGVCRLPGNLPTDRQLSVLISRSTGEQRLPLTLVESSEELGRRGKDPAVDCAGLFLPRATNTSPRISGAIVSDGTRVLEVQRVWGELDGAAKVIFLGKNPDQYVAWPGSPYPSWEVVWIISYPEEHGSRPRVSFTGLSLEQCVPGKAIRTNRAHESWIKCLTGIKAPGFVDNVEHEERLWKQYLEAASTDRVYMTGANDSSGMAAAFERSLKDRNGQGG